MFATGPRGANWLFASICAFALAAAFAFQGTASAAGDPPAAPSSLSAERHDGSIEIIFSHPDTSEVDGWQVQTRAAGGSWGDWYDLTGVSPDRVNAFIENTDNDVHYRIRFRAVNENGAGDHIKTVSRSNNRAAAPDNLRVVAQSSSVLHLVWNASDDEAITGYEYRMRASGGSWSGWASASATDSGSNKYASFSGLEADTGYQFKLRAMRGQTPGYVGRANGRTEVSGDVDG